jgi:hypothetical protein
VSTTGVATGVAVGTTTILATGTGVSAGSASLTVTSAAASTITITPPTPSVAINAQQQFTAVGTGAVPAAGPFVWTVLAGTGTGSMSSSGLYTAVTVGTVTVEASYGTYMGTDLVSNVVPVAPSSFKAASALGLTTSGPFSTATKIVKLHKYGSVEFSFGAANAGKTVIIEGAAKINGVWGSFSALTLRVADSNGNVFWHYRSASVAWLSTYGNLGGVHTNSVQARWMK